MKIIDIKAFLTEKYTEISRNAKLAFLFTSIFTFLCHLVYFVDRWANEDDFHSIFGISNMIPSGRWMPGTILNSDYLIPIILFVTVILALSLISVMIISIFKIKSKLYVFLISLLLSSFPILALGFGYGFMIERYVLGMLFAVLAVFLTDKYKYGFFAGGLALVIALGYYQSYIAITIGLSIITIIVYGLKKIDIKSYIIYISKIIIMGIIGVIGYLVLTKVICYLTGTALLSYKGINEMGSFPPINQMPELIARTYKDFIGFYLGKKFLNLFLFGKLAQLGLCVFNIFLVSYIIAKNKIYKNRINLLIIIIMLLLLPLGLNIIDFIVYNSATSSLNIYQFVFVLILPFILLNIIEKDNKNNILKLSGWIITLATVVLIWNYFLVSNLYYLKINNYYNTTIQLTNRIYDRIEQTKGFNSETKVLLANQNGIYVDSRVYDGFYKIFLLDQGIWDNFIGYVPMTHRSDHKFHILVENTLGIHLPSASSEEIKEIYNSEEYEEMESWPSKDSVGFIGEILVVKVA